jgi:hypothetical protein
MIIHKDPVKDDETELEIKIVPMYGSFLVQIASEVVRGTLIIDHSLEREDMNELWNKIYTLFDEISMRNFTNEDEIPQ